MLHKVNVDTDNKISNVQRMDDRIMKQLIQDGLIVKKRLDGQKQVEEAAMVNDGLSYGQELDHAVGQEATFRAGKMGKP